MTEANIKEVNAKEVHPMTCPACGVAMNHHADKVDYTAALSEPEAIDPELGGILEEAHTCPECGQTMMRRAAL